MAARDGGDELTRAERLAAALEAVAALYSPLKPFAADAAVIRAVGRGCFTVSDIREETGLSDKVVRRVLRDLVRCKLVERRKSTRCISERVYVLR